jgi:hypothetical protein
MSWYDGVPVALLSSGPTTNYSAAAASSSAAQSLISGGANYQPAIPYGYFQPGKSGNLIFGHANGVLTGQASATTATITIGVSSTIQSISGGTATTLLASTAMTITNLSGVGWELDFKILNRGTGIGTSSSTSLLTTGVISVSTAQSVCAPTSVTSIDASVNQWMYATVTFSTASGTNSCTLEQFMIYGMS